MKKQSFHIGDILTVVHGKLVSLDHIDGFYRILNYMTRDNLLTHQLVRASRECRPHLLRQHPQLETVDASSVTGDNWREWLDKQVALYGETLPVEPIPQDDHDRVAPYDELVIERGTDEGIILADCDL